MMMMMMMAVAENSLRIISSAAVPCNICELEMIDARLKKCFRLSKKRKAWQTTFYRILIAWLCALFGQALDK